ncbi:MAG: hypothetical protein SH820_12565 [Xanthomonadales bacterium]|nr:hypothetical protein [Xanthomonadales bacterium]
MASRSLFFASPPVWVGFIVLSALQVLGAAAHPVGTTSDTFFLSALIALTAVGLGVVAASLASPSETSEGAMFKVVAGVLLTFASGFLVTNFLAEIRQFVALLTGSNTLYAARFWMFASSFVAASIFSYVFRAYFMAPQSSRALITELDDDLVKFQAKLRKLTHSK